jgi:hypothetical protein
MPLQATSGAASYDAFGGGVPFVPTYIEDVFQTWLYTGNGSTQTITNGIDLAGKGGMTWIKSRSAATDNFVFDTNRGALNEINTNNTQAQASLANSLTAFNSNGFSLGAAAGINVNAATYASWNFRKQAKFFTFGTYTGNGTAGRQIAHDLGSVPGVVIVKVVSGSSTQDWEVYHRSLGATQFIQLSKTDAATTSSSKWNNTEPTSTAFTVGSDAGVNANGWTYAYYVFAHNAGGFGLTGTDNVISCGIFTGNTTVNLGFEPQWILLKNSGASENWYIHDTMRGWPVSGDAQVLYPNLSSAEGSTSQIYPNATGFSTLIGSGTYIYVAIRRGPMRVPTTGTSVFEPVTATSSNEVAGSLQQSDFGLFKDRALTGNWFASDRLRGFTRTYYSPTLYTNLTNAEATPTTGDTVSARNITGQLNGRIYFGGAGDPTDQPLGYSFRRAPGFFDEVCYSGSNTDNTLKPHNLGVKPEMIIVKTRSAPGSPYDNWFTWTKDITEDKYLYLNATNAEITAPNPTFGPFGTYAQMTTTGWYIQNAGLIDRAGDTYVSYLFASCPGVSKVGSYTGTAAPLQIDCGFTGGARFVLIKRTDTTGAWFVWDTARGISTGTDPYLLLNSTSAEITSNDYIDPYSAGFELPGSGTSNPVNISGGTYIFLAIA